MSDWDGIWIKCSIFNGQVIYIEKSKLKIADMWLIPLDRVTFFPLDAPHKIISGAATGEYTT